MASNNEYNRILVVEVDEMLISSRVGVPVVSERPAERDGDGRPGSGSISGCRRCMTGIMEKLPEHLIHQSLEYRG